MKWFVVVLVCLLGYGEGGALKCLPGAQDLSCTEEQEKEPPIQITEDRSTPSRPECLEGSEWESNCHACKCTDGVAKCQKISPCDREYAEPVRCKANTTFDRDCNRCSCMDNGMLLCTLVQCEKLPVRKPSEGMECAPGSHWKSQCNSCGCTERGHPFCTEMACIGFDEESLKRCAPHSEWTDDCNNCWCTAKGDPICTKRSCIRESLEMDAIVKDESTKPDPNLKPHNNDDTKTINSRYLNQGNEQVTHKTEINTELEESTIEENYFEDHTVKFYDFNHIDTEHGSDVRFKDEHNVLKRSVCKPHQEFQSDCNQCKCAADGQSYTCTKNECMDGARDKEVEVFMESEGVDHVESHTVCKPRGTFYIGCNTCHCNPYGSDYSCTNKPCPLPEDVELFHELKAAKSPTNKTKKIVCVANRMFIKDCNTCWCNEDGTSFFCTRKVCIPAFPDEDGEEKPEDLRLIKRDCRPNEVFELDCNMCRCNPDGKSFSCTRRACIDPIDEDAKNSPLSRPTRDVSSKNEPTKNCLPNQEFRMDCNKCLCDPAGQDFSCTRIDCYQLNNNNNHAETRTRRDVTGPGEKCVPGTKYKMGCNTCKCSLDGHVAMCSMDGCEKRYKRETESSPQENSTKEQRKEITETHEDKTSADNKENKFISTTPQSEADPNFRCNPGEQFKRGCNDCSCSADGKSFFCTVRFCDQDITPPPSL